MPVNVVPTDPELRGPNDDKDRYIHGDHQSHFDTCPDAAKYRGK